MHAHELKPFHRGGDILFSLITVTQPAVTVKNFDGVVGERPPTFMQNGGLVGTKYQDFGLLTR